MGRYVVIYFVSCSTYLPFVSVKSFVKLIYADYANYDYLEKNITLKSFL